MTGLEPHPATAQKIVLLRGYLEDMQCLYEELCLTFREAERKAEQMALKLGFDYVGPGKYESLDCKQYIKIVWDINNK